MFLTVILAILVVFDAHVNLRACAGPQNPQIPSVDGVLGGVPSLEEISIPYEDQQPLGIRPAATPGALRVLENSGICETTHGVYQASGYGDISSDKSIFFWFFAARKSNSHAPVALWFNGGPGSSSMIGLFQEHGPCRITNDSSTVKINPMSWNNNVHMLYIDQPVGVGFSTGTTSTSTSQQAAADVWTFLQIFFKDSRFARYQQNHLAIWTESYGGHYGPAFSSYILGKNAAIVNGDITGSVILHLKYLGIGNGLTDPLSQYPGYITYAGNNPYHPLVSQKTISDADKAWNQPGGCKSLITSCYNTGSNGVCSSAQSYCNSYILSPLAGPYDVYYVPSRNPDPYPPDFATYINSVCSKIGATKSWVMTNIQVYSNFAATGDWMRNSRQDLEKVINAGVRTLIFDGDADYIVNYVGVEAMVDALNTKFTAKYHQQPWKTYTVSGKPAGQYKQAGTFAYLRVYGAGHEVPAYKYGSLAYGEAALQFFNQTMSDHPLTST